ncbi:hypothetical protein KsCSTR_00360 [Candidatus Kuenenia stuttgartiensis]|uniref:Uncharacterized protein n=1 Tax=Kuenenia stuttgartiensis TaxID=174633 RepID=A0A6G7GIS9_KUEST|nr:hypothetical protein KsCSTR_00360 [Candidatus Kuenenia stuttgartiensis]
MKLINIQVNPFTCINNYSSESALLHWLYMNLKESSFCIGMGSSLYQLHICQW